MPISSFTSQECFSLCMAFAAISYKEKVENRKPQSMKTDECKTIDRGSSGVVTRSLGAKLRHDSNKTLYVLRQTNQNGGRLEAFFKRANQCS